MDLILQIAAVLVLASVAGAGWTFGQSLGQTGVAFVHARFARRAKERAERLRIARVMAAIAEEEKKKMARPALPKVVNYYAPEDRNCN